MFDSSSSEDMKEESTGKACVIDNKSENKEEERSMANEEEETLDRDKEKAIRSIMRYYESLYFKDSIIDDGETEAPSQNDFESLIGFLEMVNEQEIHEGCKDLVIDHFGKLVKWFYTVFMKCEERPNPVKINNTDVCLLDLYLTVKGLGGHGHVTIRNKWVQVANALGFPSECADELRECYATHLSLIEAYYGVAKNYSRESFVSEFAHGKDTKGIEARARDLPTEETLHKCSGTGAKQMNLDEECGTSGNIEFDDGETLIVSFEGPQDSVDGEEDEVTDSDEGNNLLMVD